MELQNISFNGEDLINRFDREVFFKNED